MILKTIELDETKQALLSEDTLHILCLLGGLLIGSGAQFRALSMPSNYFRSDWIGHQTFKYNLTQRQAYCTLPRLDCWTSRSVNTDFVYFLTRRSGGEP